MVPVQSSIMSDDESGNFGLIPELFQGQFISLDWNSVCSIIQSKKTGETMLQILKSAHVCVCVHAYAFIWPQHIGTQPSRGA